MLADDRDALSDFVAQTADALHASGKLLTLAIPAKERDVRTGWAGPYDYASLAAVADLVTVMAYEYRGPFSGPGSVAPVDWVQRVSAYASSQIPPEKLLLGLAFYGYDWNITSGGARSVGYAKAAALAEQFGVDAQFDPAQQSLTFGYDTVSGAPEPATPQPARPRHEIATRTPPPCDVAGPPQQPPGPRPPPPHPGHRRATRCGWKTAPAPRRAWTSRRATGWRAWPRGGSGSRTRACGRCSARGERAEHHVQSRTECRESRLRAL